MSFYTQKWDKPYLTPSIARWLIKATPAHAARHCPYFSPPVYGDSIAMAEGDLLDCLILGGTPRVVVADIEEFRTKEAREWRDAMFSEGKFPITRKKYSLIESMAAATHSSIIHSPMSGHLINGEIKKRRFWVDSEIHLSCEPDIHNGALVVDLKLTRVIPTEANWQRHVSKMAYAIQVAATLEATGATQFKWLVVERATGFAVVHTASDALIQHGQSLWSHAKDIWKACIEAGEWRGLQSGVIDPMDYELTGDDVVFDEE